MTVNIRQESRKRRIFSPGSGTWAEADDGKPFYNLELMRYYDQLRTFPGAPTSRAPRTIQRALRKEYAAAAVEDRWVPHGGRVDAGKEPDDIRTGPRRLEPGLDGAVSSRRAFLSLLADPAYGSLMPYKMMALKVVNVPVSGEVVIPEMRAVVGALCLFLAVGWIRLPGGNKDGARGITEPRGQLLRDAFLVSSPC